MHRQDMAVMRSDIRAGLSQEGKATVGFGGTPAEWRNIRATIALWAKKNGKQVHIEFVKHSGWQELDVRVAS